MYDRQELNISGKRSIVFMGEEIAWANNRETSKETKDTWDQVFVYKLDPVWKAKQDKKNRYGNKLAPYNVGIATCTKILGDWDNYRVFYANTFREILDIMEKQLPQFYRDIEEQLKTHTAPEELEYEPSRHPVE